MHHVHALFVVCESLMYYQPSTKDFSRPSSHLVWQGSPDVSNARCKPQSLCAHELHRLFILTLGSGFTISAGNTLCREFVVSVGSQSQESLSGTFYP